MRRSVLRVLTYHRVGDPAAVPSANPSLFSATPADFDRQMRHLSRQYQVVSIDEVLGSQSGDRPLPQRAVLLTFDDAYKDFGEIAWPILQRYGLPATVFVPTAYAGDPERVFWWDRLHSAFCRTSQRVVEGIPMGPLPLTSPDAKRASLRAVQAYLKTVPHVWAMQLVDAMCKDLGSDRSERSNVLSWDELRELAAEGARFVPHTRTHPALTQLPPEEARAEIRGSREDLERELGDAPRVFAFPFGAQDDRVARIVEEEGFQLAFSCRDGHNLLPCSDPLRLGRTNITRRTSPLIFRFRLLPLAPYLDRWRHHESFRTS